MFIYFICLYILFGFYIFCDWGYKNKIKYIEKYDYYSYSSIMFLYNLRINSIKKLVDIKATKNDTNTTN